MTYRMVADNSLLVVAISSWNIYSVHTSMFHNLITCLNLANTINL